MGKAGSIYDGLIKGGSYLHSLLALILRLFFGAGFIHAGLGKFGALETTIDVFHALGIPFPTFQVYLVASVELIGGFLLLIGLGSRLAAIPLLIITIVAYLTAHREALLSFLDHPMGITEQPPFAYFITALYVIVHGPGKVSLDALFKWFLLKKKNPA